MADANIMVPARTLQLLSTGSTSVPAAYTAQVPTSTQPANTTDTVTVITPPGPANGIMFMPWSTVTNQTGVGVRVIGWSTYQYAIPAKGSVWYMPQVLATFSLTITTAGTKPTYSIDNETVAPFAVSAVTGSLLTNVTPRIYGTEAGLTNTAWLGVDTAGCQFISLLFQASATAEMGAFLRWV
jgi:hypothetical protein